MSKKKYNKHLKNILIANAIILPVVGCSIAIPIILKKNSEIKESPENWFRWNDTEIIGIQNDGLKAKNIALPKKTTSITIDAFYIDSKPNQIIENIDMSLTQIESFPEENTSSLFWNFSNLKNVKLPNNLTNVPSGLFYNCVNLSSVNIPNNVNKIGSRSFYNCSSLSSINLPNSITEIGDSTFTQCSRLKSIKLPNSITIISNELFQDCSSLESIELPDSITKISESAFATCTNLKSIKLSSNL